LYANAENLKTFRGVEIRVEKVAIRAREGEGTVDEMTGRYFYELPMGEVLVPCTIHSR